MTRSRVQAAIVVAAVSAVLIPASASSAPTGTRIEAVFARNRCKAQPCEAGRDPQIRSGSSVGGTIQIHVRSSASVIGLDWVRLEAQFDGDPRWACLEQWDSPGETSFSRSMDWETRNWHFPAGKSPPQPWGCPETSFHFHGAPTYNRPFRLHVVARERVNGEMETSPNFNVTLANVPVAPTWGAAPVVSKDAAGRPIVTLEWKPNPEPDVIEYHYARAGPGGQAEYVVDAAKPEKHGCRKVESGNPRKVTSLICEDTAFPNTTFSGKFRYVFYAYRPATSGKQCTLTRRPCYESQASTIRTVAVSGTGAAAGQPTTDATGGPVLTSSPAPSAPAPVAIAPTDRRDDLAPRAPLKRESPLPLVLGFLAAAGGASIAVRAIRSRRRET